MTLFLDTNVLIDFLLERDDFYAAAASIVSYAAESDVSIAVSALTMVNANYICIERCKMPLEIYERKINFLRNFIIVCNVDSSDVYNSYDNQWKDFEDGVQYYCATRNGANFIVTRNVKDFKGAALPTVLPDEALDIIQSEIGKRG